MATFVAHYAVLGVNSTADSATIRKAYLGTARGTASWPFNTTLTRLCLASYDILLDVTKRKDYDIKCNRHSKAAHAPSRVARVFQPETDGSYGAGYDREEMGDEEEEDYPSDTPRDPGCDCQDTGDYKDGYADAHYKSYRTSDDVAYGRFDSYGICTGGFDSTASHYQFPDEFADDFPPAQGCDNEWDASSQYDRDEESSASRISPID